MKCEFTAHESVGDVPRMDEPAGVSAALDRGDAVSVVDHRPGGAELFDLPAR